MDKVTIYYSWKFTKEKDGACAGIEHGRGKQLLLKLLIFGDWGETETLKTRTCNDRVNCRWKHMSKALSFPLVKDLNPSFQGWHSQWKKRARVRVCYLGFCRTSPAIIIFMSRDRTQPLWILVPDLQTQDWIRASLRFISPGRTKDSCIQLYAVLDIVDTGAKGETSNI